MHSHGFSGYLVHLLKFYAYQLWKESRVYYEGDSQGVYSFDEISNMFGFE